MTVTAPAPARLRTTSIALVGAPNSGKTTLFNALTGLRAKVGNHPGVTVARYVGRARVGAGDDPAVVDVEDLPGTYSLAALSPDEQVVVDALDPTEDRVPTPDGLVVALDATSLPRGLGLLAQVLVTELPIVVALTFTDELTLRQGTVDAVALRRALGVPVVRLVASRKQGLDELRGLLADPAAWPTPVVPPPTHPAEVGAWVTSVLTTASYASPGIDERTRRTDAVLLHPLWGTLVFAAVMYGLFQVIFSVAAPLQGRLGDGVAAVGRVVHEQVRPGWLAGLLGDGVVGGVGTVLTFLPQIALLFLLVSLLESVGYMARAAFLMDRVLARAGLEGRAFVALLSSLACAVPGIMATRTMPSARQRIATMMGAPLMTCSARLPVYVLLIGLLVPRGARVGPFGAQGTVMFGLYLLGAVSALLTAWLFARIGRGRGPLLPFYLEMPPYRLPTTRSVALSVWEACKHFLRKVGRIILVTSVVLWLLLNLPTRGGGELRAAGVDPRDDVAVTAYVLDHSAAATIGKAIAPAFAPLGFDWRIDIGLLSAASAREVFVATMGQVAAAANPDDPAEALRALTVTSGPRTGERLFTPPALAALLVFFLYALQCMSTVGALRRESGSWRWPAIAWAYMLALAWGMGLLAHAVVGALA